MAKKKKFIGGYVDEKIKKELGKMAKQEERSITYMLEKILLAGVKHRGGKGAN